MVAPKSSARVFLVGPDSAGLRVERLLMDRLGCSRAEARRLCALGAVQLDGCRSAKGQRVTPGARLVVQAGDEPPVTAEPEQPLTVRLERADLVVVEKEAGTPTVPLRAGQRGTLAGALIARYPEMAGFGRSSREPGVVHRLDTQTSGLVLAARDGESFARLLAHLRAGRLEKRYLAICEAAGMKASGAIEFPLSPDPKHYGRVVVTPPGARYSRPARTEFRLIERGVRFALIELIVSRAFRHQIRAHLAAIGHPIAGDALYSGSPVGALGNRHALHASVLGFAGEQPLPFRVTSDPPASFLEIVRATEHG